MEKEENLNKSRDENKETLSQSVWEYLSDMSEEKKAEIAKLEAASKAKLKAQMDALPSCPYDIGTIISFRCKKN